MKIEKDSNYSIQSVERAVKVLRAFTMEKNRLSLTELHEVTQLGKSTLQRLLYTLTKERLLQRSESDKRYQLGLEFIFLAEMVKENSSLLSIASPIMEKLKAETNESVSLNIIEDSQRKCISKIDSKHELSAALSHVGQTSPLHAGAAAKVLLAHLPEEKLNEYLANTPLDKITDNTIVSKDKLLQELKTIKRQGYGISFGERVKGAISISAPVFDPYSNIVASLTINLPWIRMDEYNQDDLINSVVKYAQELTNNMRD